MRQARDVKSVSLREDGLTQILASVVEEVKLSISRDISGADLLYSLLNAPWLKSLLKVYERLQWYMRAPPSPYFPFASSLSHQMMADLRGVAAPSSEARQLYKLLRDPHLQAFLSAHDIVAQKSYGPVLPPLPNNLPDDEEAFRIVCLVKNNQPLGATIKRNELTGEISVARVIRGGLAERSGLLYAGDKIMEVNGQPVEGLEAEQIIEILAQSQGTIMFKVVPMSDRPVNSQTLVYVRAMIDYSPFQDPTIPCADAGMAFRKGDVLQIVDQTDALWWQGRNMPSNSSCAGLIPSIDLLRRRQREMWWSQALQPGTCTPHMVETAGFSRDSNGPAVSILFREPNTTIPLVRAFQPIKLLLTDITNFIFSMSCGPQVSSVDKDEDLDDACFEAEEAECSRNSEGIYLAGFRRSLRLCQRKARRFRMQSCNARCLSSCCSSLANPYEEMVRYQRHPEDKLRLIALMGPRSVDINELRRRLIAVDPKTYQGPIPHTTRPLKCFEKSGREYHFISRELFENMLYNHRFLEYGEYKGHLYGISISSIRNVLDSGKICIVDIDPHGLQAIRTHELKAYIIFVKSPSTAHMKQTRAKAQIADIRPSRNEDVDEVEEAAKMESFYCQFFDEVIVNNGLQDSCLELLEAIRRAQKEPQWVPASWIRPTVDSSAEKLG
ncbi:MAGUK p55 subfamily member 4-like [Brienomyrus brachyistius]|uniref:MAGUK p55 subfamily member 4-like n=1 Tax=Brienomyrus brachyistius TaxID=42636 RepID=UPI0020B3DDA9|nr:MAGUK p55 subfamily member 4-like [Brienomyrus brachyistius]